MSYFRSAAFRASRHTENFLLATKHALKPRGIENPKLMQAASSELKALPNAWRENQIQLDGCHPSLAPAQTG